MSDKYYGDITPGKTIRIPLNSNDTSGAPITLAGSPAVSIHKDNSTTQSTAGVTLTVDFDGLVGYHVVTINTSADETFYAAGSDFRAYLSAGTVSGVSQIGVLVGSFSISNRSALRPTIANSTLDVSDGMANANIIQILGEDANIEDGTATAGSSNTITLNRSYGTNVLRGRAITIIGGTGDGQSEVILSNTNASPSVVTINRPWLVAPDNTSKYIIESTVSHSPSRRATAIPNFSFKMADPGLTVTAQRRIDNGSFEATDNSPTEVANKLYTINLTANDLNGQVITLRFSASGVEDVLLTLFMQ